MRGNPGGPEFWGNSFPLPEPVEVPLDEWICVEVMVKMNDPVSSHNGEQAYWINGELVNHLGEGFPNGTWVWDGFHIDPAGEPFEGFQWRTDPELDINYVWVLHYVDTDPNAEAWYDHVVVATEYIGPISSGGPPPVVSVGDVAISEGDSGSKQATFTLTLAEPEATAPAEDGPRDKP
jgi:hypothetical protein